MKLLQIERADARTRTGDPFITSEVLYQLSYVGEASTVAALRDSALLGRGYGVFLGGDGAGSPRMIGAPRRTVRAR
jgi:hypothetical protein